MCALAFRVEKELDYPLYLLLGNLRVVLFGKGDNVFLVAARNKKWQLPTCLGFKAMCSLILSLH
jgi:hypothetical protein